MKKSSLLFNKCKVYCFLPEEYWRKQLTGPGIGLTAALIPRLF